MIVVITDINIFDFGMGKGTYSYILIFLVFLLF